MPGDRGAFSLSEGKIDSQVLNWILDDIGFKKRGRDIGARLEDWLQNTVQVGRASCRERVSSPV